MSRAPVMFEHYQGFIAFVMQSHYITTLTFCTNCAYEHESKQVHIPVSLFYNGTYNRKLEETHNFPGGYAARNHVSCNCTSILWNPNFSAVTNCWHRLNIFETGSNSWLVSLQHACLHLHCCSVFMQSFPSFMHMLLFYELLLLLLPLPVLECLH
jgi:hypothetical protein